MSLRAWFAGQTLSGIMAGNYNATKGMTADNAHVVIAEMSVKLADALIAELNKEQ